MTSPAPPSPKPAPSLEPPPPPAPAPAPSTSPTPPPAPSPTPSPLPSWATGPHPLDNPHVCVLCGAPIRKNAESYRGPIPREMVAAIRRERPDFHPKQDFCKPCGEKWFRAIAPTLKPPPWMSGRLG